MYQYDIEIIRGETLDKDIEFEVTSGSFSLSGKTAKAQVRRERGYPTLAAEMTATVDDDTVHLSLTADQTTELEAGKYEWDVFLLGNNFRRCYVGGKFLVRERVTVVDDEPIEELTNVAITVTWDDDDDAAEARPQEITLSLMADGLLYQTQTFVGTGTSWTCTFENVPVYDDDDNEITYTAVLAEDVADYTASYSEDGQTVTMTYQGE